MLLPPANRKLQGVESLFDCVYGSFPPISKCFLPPPALLQIDASKSSASSQLLSYDHVFFFLTNSPFSVSAKEIQMHTVSTMLMCAVVKVVVCSLKTCNRITSTKSRTFGRLTGYFFYLFFSLQEQQCAERERGRIVRWQG